MMLSSSLKSQDRSLWIIIPIVLAVHFLIALLLNGLNHEPVTFMPKKGVVVHSVKLSPKAAIQKDVREVPVKVEASPPKPQAEKKTASAPAKVVPIKPAVKKKAPEAPPVPKPEKPKIVKAESDRREWIAAAKEKIGKIALSSDTISNSSHQKLKDIATPSPIENFITDLAFVDSGTTFNVKESAYRDELAMRLRLSLKLPEYGEVKVKLTIDRTGKITSTKILSFQSAKNASFIEQNLPKIKMPPFGDNFKGSSDYDFTIVLSNE